MVIQLTPEVEALLDDIVQRGDYADREAAVAEAVRVLAERDQYARLKAAIAVGMEQYERGEMIPWTPDLLDQLKREAEEDIRLGRPFDDEVIP